MKTPRPNLIPGFRRPSPLRVLLVGTGEDVYGIRDLLVESVDGGCEVSIAGSGADARVALSAGNIDLILLSLDLPDGSGAAVFEQVNPMASGIPVIVLAGNHDDAVVLACIAGGATDAVRGPLHPQAVLRSVQHALERQDVHRAPKNRKTDSSVSDALWQNLAVNCPDGIVVVDSGGRIIWVNRQTESMFGYPQADLIDQSIEILVPADQRKHHLPLRQAYSASPSHRAMGQNRNLSGQTRDGGIFPVEIMLNAFEENGETMTIAMVRDVTEAVALRKASARGHELNRLILETASDAFVSIDSDSRIRNWNRAAETMFGWKREEAMGLTMTDLIIPQRYRARHMQGVRRYLDGGHSRIIGQTIEITALRRDGTEFPIEITIWAFEDIGETRFNAFIRDITARKAAEGALEKSRQEFQAIFENAPIGIYRSTRDGRLLMANPTFARIYGFETVGAMTQEVPNLEQVWANPADRRQLTDQLDLTNEVRDFTAKQVRRDGEPITVQLSMRSVFDEDGNHSYYEGMIRDVTEHRALEQQLRQSQKLEAIGALAAGVAHDFNNLLTVILGYSYMVVDRIEENHPLRPKMQEIRKAAQHASALTRQLLVFGRKQVLRPRMLDLNASVDGVGGMLRRLIGEHIELTTVLEPRLGMVLTDPTQVEQILMNLCVNSRDAMPDGGRLVIETSNVNISPTYCRHHPEARPGPHVRLSVSDNGSGMDPATLEHVFEPFFTTKESGLGTGVGLATVYGIVKQHKGWIGLYSEPGKGTTFRVYLPEQTGEVERPAPIEPPISSLRGSERILLVEDQAEVRAFACEVLAENGYAVLEASDGLKALDIIRRDPEPIDLLLTDVVMPGMSGPKLAEEARLYRPDIRVLFASGYPEKMITQKDLLQADFVLIEKPYIEQVLLGNVRRSLGAHRKPSEHDDTHTVLIVEDDPAVQTLLQEILEDAGYRVAMAADGVVGLRRLREMDFDFLLTDIIMPLKDGIDLAAEARREFPDMPIIGITGAPEAAKLAQEQETFDALGEKPIIAEQLLSLIGAALKRKD